MIRDIINNKNENIIKSKKKSHFDETGRYMDGYTFGHGSSTHLNEQFSTPIICVS